MFNTCNPWIYGGGSARKVFGVWRGWQRSEVRGVQGQVIKVNNVMDGRLSRKVQVRLLMTACW